MPSVMHSVIASSRPSHEAKLESRFIAASNGELIGLGGTADSVRDVDSDAFTAECVVSARRRATPSRATRLHPGVRREQERGQRIVGSGGGVRVGAADVEQRLAPARIAEVNG